MIEDGLKTFDSLVFESPYFPQHAFNRTAPLLPSRIRYNAESTVIVTSPAEE